MACELRREEKRSQGKKWRGSGRRRRRKREKTALTGPSYTPTDSRASTCECFSGPNVVSLKHLKSCPGGPRQSGHCGLITERALREDLEKPSPEKGVGHWKKTHCP